MLSTVSNASKSNIGLWTLISLAAIVFLLSFGYVIYVQANPNPNIWKALWGYLESETFRSLLPSVAVPIIVFVFGIYDKTVKDIQTKKEEDEKRKREELRQEEERREKRRKEEEERREKRTQAIEKTSAMLRQINSLVSEVRFYEDTKGSSISDVLKRIASQSSSLTEVINIWNFSFSLPKSSDSLFVDYIRVLYWGAWATAHSINKGIGGNREELQENLAMMQRGIVAIAFDPILNTLKHFNQLLDLTEGLSLSYGDQKQDKIINLVSEGIEKNLNQCFSPEGTICIILQGVSNELSPQIPNEPLKAIWLNCKKRILDEIQPKINKLVFYQISIDEETRKKIEEEVNSVSASLFQLRTYKSLLNLDKFINEEILPPQSGDKEANEAIALRTSYQLIKKFIRESSGLDINSPEYEEFLKSKEYEMFKNSFYNVRETELINIIAKDTLRRVKEIGNKLRFSSQIPLRGENIEPVK